MKNRRFVLYTFFTLVTYLCSAMHASDKQIQQYSGNNCDKNVPQQLVTLQTSRFEQLVPYVLANLSAKRLMVGWFDSSDCYTPNYDPKLAVAREKQYSENLNIFNHDFEKLTAVIKLIFKNNPTITLPEADLILFMEYATYKTEQRPNGEIFVLPKQSL